nr:S-adenosylmethionine:tRNA ribosyltransferase-isomerase [Kofleriaceae bacterium]
MIVALARRFARRSAPASPDGDVLDALRGALPAFPTLRTDDVPRHAMRLVTIARRGDAPPVLGPFASLPAQLRDGDLVVVNDAATLPGSLHGTTSTGERFELRLTAPIDDRELTGVVLGPGDHRTRTELRAAPPALVACERVVLAGVGDALVASARGRLVTLRVELAVDELWQRLYSAGRAIQYAHRPALLPLFAVQTAYAARPWAAEMPSAGRGLTWDTLLGLRRAGIAIARLTHAAGISSTGDAALDRALPWPERYDIPAATAAAITAAKQRGGRVVAIGTTVVRALEHARGAAGPGIATNRLDARSQLRVVDGLVSGLHVPGESHFDLLTAFAHERALRAAILRAAEAGLSAHELGDACLLI